ncbi:MAG: D-alanyl-D-alanine carboxypeptidase, partial [Muribaculaceae bacterium]|nr:D-alanyl-D-alanine carboxypeptidase [Muribaculaceae bacterium]
MIKKLICATLALVSAGIAFGQCPLTFTGSNQAIVGVYVAPVNGDEPIVDYNSEQLMTPASVMKSVTVASALSRYGGDFRWQTTVKTIGLVSNGTLRGNIEVTGTGDPTLGSAQFRKEREGFLTALRNAATKAGINRITGRTVQASPWPDQGPVPSWEIEDIPGIDGAGFYTLNWNDNVFNLTVPSLNTSPKIPGLKIHNAGGKGGLKFFRNPGSYDLTLP